MMLRKNMRKDELKVQDRLYGRAFDQKVELDNQKHIAVIILSYILYRACKLLRNMS